MGVRGSSAEIGALDRVCEAFLNGIEREPGTEGTEGRRPQVSLGPSVFRLAVILKSQQTIRQHQTCFRMSRMIMEWSHNVGS